MKQKPKYTSKDIKNATPFDSGKETLIDGIIIASTHEVPFPINGKNMNLNDRKGNLDKRILELSGLGKNLKGKYGNRHGQIYQELVEAAYQDRLASTTEGLSTAKEYDAMDNAFSKLLKDPENKALQKEYKEAAKGFSDAFKFRGEGAFSDYEPNECYCVQKAVGMIKPLHEAGIDTILVTGYMTFGRDTGSAGAHAFLVSKKTGAILDPSRGAGKDYNYLTVLNKGADITKGDTLIVKDRAGNIAAYGTGKYDKDKHPKIENEHFFRVNLAITEHDRALMQNVVNGKWVEPGKKEEALVLKSPAQNILDSHSYDPNSDLFINNSTNKAVKETGRGNAKGFHFDKVSLVDSGKGSLNVWVKGKGLQGKIEYSDFDEKVTEAKAKGGVNSIDDVKGAYSYDHSSRTFTHKETGKTLKERGAGNAKGFHFDGLSLVDNKNGGFNIWQKGASIPAGSIKFEELVPKKQSSIEEKANEQSAKIDARDAAKELAAKGMEAFDGLNGKLPQDVIDNALSQAKTHSSPQNTV